MLWVQLPWIYAKLLMGLFDGFVDTGEGLALWDYAGAALICRGGVGQKVTDSEATLFPMN